MAKKIVDFYLSCVEAEDTDRLKVRVGGEEYLSIEPGPFSFQGAIRLPDTPKSNRWCETNRKENPESLILGWPICVGQDRDSWTTVISPLLIVETRLKEVDGSWRCERTGRGIELNSSALGLLGVSDDERYSIDAAIEKSVAVEEAKGIDQRADAILSTLQDTIAEGVQAADRTALQRPTRQRGIQNAAIVLPPGDPSRIHQNLIQELRSLKADSDLTETGPAAVILGKETTDQKQSITARPTLVLSTLNQDRAVNSAMENTLTVVTGPPGTGKSQVLVNVVAAVLERGETVLIASKNNQAVDVVVERIRSTSQNAIVIRAGPAYKRDEVARHISQLVADSGREGPKGTDLEATQSWHRAAEQIQLLYDVLDKRREIIEKRDAISGELSRHLHSGRGAGFLDVDLASLKEALRIAKKSLGKFNSPLPLILRRKRHATWLERAKRTLAGLGELTGTDRAALDACLSQVTNDPRRTSAPLDAFRPIAEQAESNAQAAQKKKRKEAIDSELSRMLDDYHLEDQLSSLSGARIDASHRYLDAVCWRRIREHQQEAWNFADRLADKLKRVAKRDARPRDAHALVEGALPALPVWATTNLSVGTNLPLKTGLFDLVVIDEASQCDAASALPLLARGKRALIVGDDRQLTHITSLGEAREASIAERCGLSDQLLGNYTYRGMSCFDLAKTRINGRPILLDLHFRSHPAVVEFSNRQFYERRLIMCGTHKPKEGVSPIEWIDVTGRCIRGRGGQSWKNPDEAKALIDQLRTDVANYPGQTVGIVTPYRLQAQEIKSLLQRIPSDTLSGEVEVATAHVFQGGERDVIYFSPVIDRRVTRSQAAFAADSNLLNVALTRARRRLVVCGDQSACQKHANDLSELVDYVNELSGSGFDSPLEKNLFDALKERGVEAQPGVNAGNYRLDLAIERNGIRLDIECDGAPFHRDREQDSARDRELSDQGWTVLRFSGREITHRIEGCVAKVMDALALSD